MLEIIVTLVMIFTAYRMGSLRATNIDITKQTQHMQDLIDQAYQKRDVMKRMWLDAEEKAQSWERRYWALVEVEEEQVGS